MSRAALLLTAGAALLYVGLTAAQLTKPLMYDDANFALAARAVAQTGVPYGNQGWMSERGDFSQRDQWALWHPPLYVYLIGLAVKLAGWTPPALRMVGLLGGLASGLLTCGLARQITRGPPHAREVAGAVAAVLFWTCPLVIQSTLVVDIDLALLLPLTLLFLLMYVRLEATNRWPLLVPLFAVLVWAKMTNPLALAVVIGVWQALRGKLRRAAVHVIAIGGGGAVLFVASWYAVANVFGFPFDMPFGVNLVQWQDSTEVARRAYTSPGAFLEALQPTVVWLGPGLVALGLAGCGVRLAMLARSWRFSSTDLLLGLLGALVLGYVNKYAGWFPKYEVAMAPLLAALGAPLVGHAWCTRRDLALAVGGVVAIAVAGVDAGLVRDRWAMERTWSIDPPAAALLLLVLLAAIGGGALVARVRGSAAAAIAALAGISLGWSVATDLDQLQAAYSTTYWYGTAGVEQAAQWIDAHLAPGATYVGAKEVAIRATDQRYVDQDDLVTYFSTGRSFDGTWAGEPARAAVVWEREPYVAQLLATGLARAGFLQTARFGDYVVYEPAAASR